MYTRPSKPRPRQDQGIAMPQGLETKTTSLLSAKCFQEGDCASVLRFPLNTIVNSQTHLSGYHWDLIMSIHLGGISIYPWFILYTVPKGGSVGEWLACWTQAQKDLGSNRSRDTFVNSLRQTVHTHCASVHQAAKLVAAFLRVLQAWRRVTAAYHWVYDSHHLPRIGISSGTLHSVIEYGLTLHFLLFVRGGSVDERLACWVQAQ